jgi:low temperature requirement protein LtrA
MTAGGGGDDGAELLRREGVGPGRATFLELFFDLGYVFALTRVAFRLFDDLTVHRHIVLTSVAETTLLFLAIWLVWSRGAWVTSWYDPRHPAIQLVLVGMMLGSMLMAVALPEAFGGRAGIFVGAYVAVQVGRPLTEILVLRGEQWLIPARILCWSGASAVPWIVGASVGGGPARGVLWTLALALDYTGAAFGHPTPRLGRTRSGEWGVVSGEHLAERYQQFLNIALGESILVVGLTFAADGLGPYRTIGFLASFTTTILLWRIYFYRAGQVLADAIATSSRPAGFKLSAPYTQLVMVGGILATGVGSELVIEHPREHLDPAWLAVIFGGPALFLAGRSRFEYEVFARVSWSRVIGLLALAVLAPAMVPLPPLWAGATATVVLAGVALGDAMRARKRPPEAPSPRR